MTTVETSGAAAEPDFDSLAGQLWPGVVEEIDELVRRADSYAVWATQPGTPLAGDDRATRPFQLSHAVQLLLNAGIDNLNGVRHLTFGRPDHDHGGQMILHQAAHYVLARGAIENFATALWMLGPRRRAVRVERLVRWHIQNVNDSHSATDRFGVPAPKERGPRLSELESIALASLGQLPPRLRRGYSTTDVVRYVDELRPSTGLMSTHFIWQLCSGFAHARPWAHLTFLERDLQPTPDPDVLHARLTSSMGRALFAPKHALELCDTLLHRHERLNSRPFDRV